ncbi:MAG: molybdopterin converting factor subunit 1 [Anaerolineae bacterium]|nr:molybdopterin converting factor subunit 1 [Anaerolineae bacterium]NUQ03852.1 molybdopterin converting factor subunit 1 [Anaerolineae bacterium]
MIVKILLFATLKDRAGVKSFDLALSDSEITVAAVRQAVAVRFPAVTKHLETAIAALNEEFAAPEMTVKDGDSIAFFPPVSGGSGESPAHPEIFLLPDAPYSIDAIIAAITIPATGAVCIFSGTVRGETTSVGEAQRTLRLEYEAYAPMALTKMRQVAQEIRMRWDGVQGIAIVQRIGVLEVGQNTVLIACSSAHRDGGCFEAARYGIDRLKEIVPVWKKDVRPDGSAWIEGGYYPTPQD